jgi:peptidoglycan-associated lipoprotein
MNVISRKLCLVLVALAVVATGCTKKPQRPDPSATLGMGGAGLTPSDINTLDPLLLDGSASGLQLRDGVIEDAFTIRGLLESVYFDFDQSAIRADQRVKLAAAQEYLQQNPQHRILLEGHCDWRGTAEYNLGLGERRANSAQQYLITLGVSTNRIQTSSKGDLEAVENATEAQMALDRRVELVILKQ